MNWSHCKQGAWFAHLLHHHFSHLDPQGKHLFPQEGIINSFGLSMFMFVKSSLVCSFVWVTLSNTYVDHIYSREYTITTAFLWYAWMLPGAKEHLQRNIVFRVNHEPRFPVRCKCHVWQSSLSMGTIYRNLASDEVSHSGPHSLYLCSSFKYRAVVRF